MLSIFIGGCSTPTTTDNGPLVFKQEYSGNVSASLGTLGAARDSANDPTAPQFYWRRSTGALDSLSGQTGKVVLLNFWATWCGPCTAEMPDLEAISLQYPSDSVVVIGVSVDNNGDAFAKVSNYCKQNGDTYQMVIDSDYMLYRRYAVDGYGANFDIPYSFLISPQGFVYEYFVGKQQKATFVKEINRIR